MSESEYCSTKLAPIALTFNKKVNLFTIASYFFEELCDPSETTVPHVLPLLLLLEKSAVILEGSESWESLESGMDTVLCHLNSARTIACHGETCCSNAMAKLQGKENLSPCISFNNIMQIYLLRNPICDCHRKCSKCTVSFLFVCLLHFFIMSVRSVSYLQVSMSSQTH